MVNFHHSKQNKIWTSISKA